MTNEVLLIRSGRHLHSAMSTLRVSFPGARITVVSNHGSHDVLDRVGVDARDRVVGRWSRISVSALLGDPVGRGLLRRPGTLEPRAAHVAVLWPDPDGTGCGNVTRAALCLSPRGFLSITPDGAIRQHSGGRWLFREAVNGLLSIITLAAVFGVLTVPGRLWRSVRVSR